MRPEPDGLRLHPVVRRRRPGAPVLTHDLIALILGLHRVVYYAGYVLLAGTFTFWILVWPDGQRDTKLRALAAGGGALIVVCTVLQPVLLITLTDTPADAVFSSVVVASSVLRMAGVVGAMVMLHYTRDVPVTGWRRWLAVVVVAVIAVSMVLQSNAIGGRWEALKVVATTGHVLATSAWLGGLVAMATVLIPREFLSELDRLIPRFSVVATVSIGVLAVTGIIHAVAVAGGVGPLAGSRYGAVLAIKLLVFGGMLLLGNQGRKYAARVAFRTRHHRGEALKPTAGVHLLAVVMGAELAIAFVVLGVTSALVMVAPLP